MSFGKRLAEIRKKHGYTRERLAEELCISKYTLRNYELEATEPAHAFLKQISDFFNVSIDYLMGLTDDAELLNTFRLHSSEQNMIEKYRSLDSHGKEMVDFTLTKEWERSVDIKKTATVSVFRKPENDHLAVNAAHDARATDEQQANADRIMMDDKEWE